VKGKDKPRFLEAENISGDRFKAARGNGMPVAFNHYDFRRNPQIREFLPRPRKSPP
jgi:hypothetical protein